MCLSYYIPLLFAQRQLLVVSSGMLHEVYCRCAYTHNREHYVGKLASLLCKSEARPRERAFLRVGKKSPRTLHFTPLRSRLAPFPTRLVSRAEPARTCYAPPWLLDGVFRCTQSLAVSAGCLRAERDGGGGERKKRRKRKKQHRFGNKTH